MEKKIEELVKFLNQKMEQEGRTVTNNRFSPRSLDLKLLKLIKTEEDLKSVIKVSVARGYLAIAEWGGASYRLTQEGQNLALNAEKTKSVNGNKFIVFINSPLFVAIITVIATTIAGVLVEISK